MLILYDQQVNDKFHSVMNHFQIQDPIEKKKKSLF